MSLGATLQRWLGWPVPSLMPHTLSSVALLAYSLGVMSSLEDAEAEADTELSLLMPLVHLNFIHCIGVWVAVILWRLLIGAFHHPVETEILRKETLWYLTWRFVFILTQMHGDNSLLWMVHLSVYCFCDMTSSLLSNRLKHTPQTSTYPSGAHCVLGTGLLLTLITELHSFVVLSTWTWSGVCEPTIAMLMLVSLALKTVQALAGFWPMYGSLVSMRLANAVRLSSVANSHVMEVAKELVNCGLYGLMLAYLAFFMNVSISGISFSVSPGSLVSLLLLRQATSRLLKLRKQRDNYVSVLRMLKQRCRMATREEMEGEDMRCSICWDAFEATQDIQHLPCAHLFHTSCLITWLEHSVSCPICRKSLLDEPEVAEQMRMQPIMEERTTNSDSEDNTAGGELAAAPMAAADNTIASAAGPQPAANAIAPAQAPVVANVPPPAGQTQSRGRTFLFEATVATRFLPRIDFGVVWTINGSSRQRIVLQTEEEAAAARAQAQAAAPTAGATPEPNTAVNRRHRALNTATSPPDHPTMGHHGEHPEVPATMHGPGHGHPAPGLAHVAQRHAALATPGMHEMIEEVHLLFPQFSLHEITGDLLATQDVQQTINNILDGRVMGPNLGGAAPFDEGLPSSVLANSLAILDGASSAVASASSASEFDATAADASAAATISANFQQSADSLTAGFDDLLGQVFPSSAPSDDVVMLNDDVDDDSSDNDDSDDTGDDVSDDTGMSSTAITSVSGSKSSFSSESECQRRIQLLRTDVHQLHGLIETPMPSPPATSSMDGLRFLFESKKHEMLTAARRRYLSRIETELEDLTKMRGRTESAPASCACANDTASAKEADRARQVMSSASRTPSSASTSSSSSRSERHQSSRASSLGAESNELASSSQSRLDSSCYADAAPPAHTTAVEVSPSPSSRHHWQPSAPAESNSGLLRADVVIGSDADDDGQRRHVATEDSARLRRLRHLQAVEQRLQPQ